jgi:hypothetical protein
MVSDRSLDYTYPEVVVEVGVEVVVDVVVEVVVTVIEAGKTQEQADDTRAKLEHREANDGMLLTDDMVYDGQ